MSENEEYREVEAEVVTMMICAICHAIVKKTGTLHRENCPLYRDALIIDVETTQKQKLLEAKVKMKKWLFSANVKGVCDVIVEAETADEASEKARKGDFEIDFSSVEWDAILDKAEIDNPYELGKEE